MSEEKAGGFISQIQFNNGQGLDISKNDIIVFVGPNNAGKSQALKDIYTLSEKKVPSVVVSDVKITKSSLPISSVLSAISKGTNNGSYTTYNVLNSLMNIRSNTDTQFQSMPFFDQFRNLFVINLDTSARLTICSAPQNIRRDENKSHPIHYAAFDGKYRKWLSDNFKKAFGVEITPNIQYGAAIPLCIGKPVILEGDYEDEITRQEDVAKILETYDQVQNQGDGIKSFTGILLYLMLDYYRIYLIDEPESFLHPPQARIMGQIIGQTLSDNQQAFISTHSEEIIKGLLEVCPERIKIVRITRDGNINKFSILNNIDFNRIWSDPLLKYSNIMASLFHKTVVLCESDSDCKMYSIIESHIKQKQQKYSETLFIHCGGKHRMSKIIQALRSLNVAVTTIVDIDILNDEAVFKGIVEAYGIDYNSIKPDYNKIVSNLRSPKENVDRITARSIINQVLDGANSKYLSSAEIEAVREAVSIISKWKELKSSGIYALKQGDSASSFRKIDKLLKEYGVYIVPVGELECFIKEVGGHGPEWVNKVLVEYTNLDDEVYKSITEFITSMNL